MEARAAPAFAGGGWGLARFLHRRESAYPKSSGQVRHPRLSRSISSIFYTRSHVFIRSSCEGDCGIDSGELQELIKLRCRSDSSQLHLR